MKTCTIEKILYIDANCRKGNKYVGEVANLEFEDEYYTVKFFTIRGYEYIGRDKTSEPTVFEFEKDTDDGKLKICHLNKAMIIMQPEKYEELCAYLNKEEA